MGSVQSTFVGMLIIDAEGEVRHRTGEWTQINEDFALPEIHMGESYTDALEQSDSSVARQLQRAIDQHRGNPDTAGCLQQVEADESTTFEVRSPVNDGQIIIEVYRGEKPTEAVSDALKARVIEEAPIGITIATTTTEQGDNPLVYINDAFEEITGYGWEEAVGHDCRFLQGPDTKEQPVAELAAAIDEHRSTTVVLKNYTKDDEPFWNELTIAPLHGDGGEITHYLGFQEDVSEREQAKRDLQTERDRLDVLNQVVRHDIRNDMAVVLGWAEMLEDNLGEGGQDAYQRILEAANHAKDLTESVRDLSELVGATDPELEPVSFTEILDREVEQIRSRFAPRPGEVTIEYKKPDEPIQVKATSLLSSVFTNILNNAVYHNDKDDIAITVDVETDTETVTTRIADNGPGIPDDRKDAVFGRGEQGIDSGGSGLGLYLVDSLVDTYGGSVHIEDNEPEGTVVVVTLQRA